MLEFQQNWRLNIVAFLLSLLTGWLALAGEPFLFLWLFVIAVWVGLFHSSPQLKTAARFSLMGFVVGILVLIVVLMNFNLD